MTTELRAGTPEEAGLDPARVERIKALCQKWVDDGTHPALCVLVARRGVIALHEAFGRLGPEPDAPELAPDAIFAISSLTKLITATAVMMLVEDGVVGLTRPVQEYIPEFTGDGKDLVCVHHLLTHTSGLRDEDNFVPALAKWDQDVPPPEATAHRTVHKLLRLSYDLPVWKKPGEEMAYCTYNYELVGEIVRRVTGCALSDFVRARIFDALGMTETHYVLPEQLVPRLVRRSPVVGATWPVSDFEKRSFQETPWASVGAYGTALDVATFAQMFLDGGIYGGKRILAPNTVAEMTRNQIPGIGAWVLNEYHREASWGYGWAVESGEMWSWFISLPLGSFSHWGAGLTAVWGDPNHELLGVFFSVCTRYEAFEHQVTSADLFANAVTSAVDE